MQDKLLNILKIRIDAINRNIDNLNYLNAELDKNTSDLNYIEEKIAIFKGGEVLNFADLPRDEFEKVLTMIAPNVTEIFSDKTCNYQGIMYIIEGIKQGISLELTTEQENAIKTFIGEMINKKSNLEDIIANLNESKSKLPEVNMTNLTNSLKDYQTIISKLEDNLYIIEIDEIIDTLEFANVGVEEKIGIFEFLLKYNADIYATNQTPISIPKEDDFSLKEINVPEFHYEPINIYGNEEVSEEKDLDTEDTSKIATKVELPKEEMPLETKAADSYEEISLPTFENVSEVAEPEMTDTKELNDIIGKIDAKLKELDNYQEEVQEETEVEPEETTEIEVPKDTFVPEFHVPEVETSIASPIKTIDLPEVDIAPKEELDAIPSDLTSLPEEESEETQKEVKEENNEQEENTETEIKVTPIEEFKTPEITELPKEEPTNVNQDSEIKEVLKNYGLENADFNLQNLQLEDVKNNLKTLEENKILEELKENTILEDILKLENTELVKVIDLVKNNLENNLKENLEIIIHTMPIILTKKEAILAFSKNIEFFKEHKINVNNLFDNYKELLILDNEILTKNYNEAKSYGFELTNDNVKYLLYNRRLLENLDFYIEARGEEKGFLGRESEFDGIEYVNKNPYKLNYMSRDTLMKLRYQSENGGKIYGSKPGILSGEIANPKVDVLTLSNDYKGLYFDNEYNFIDRSELLELIEEIKKSEEFNITTSGLIEKLDEKYKIDNLRYQIDGVIFSRIKTIRLYNFLSNKNLSEANALIIALTYNSVIKRDEYLKVLETINNMVGGN